MEIDELRQLAQNRPFRAFEIRVDNGEKHLIENPENILLHRNSLSRWTKAGERFSSLLKPSARFVW